MSLTPKLLSLAVLMAIAGTASAGAAKGPAVDRAHGLLQSNGAAVHASVQDRFAARDVIVDADGTEHVRFERSYAGLPVIGGDFVLHSRGGQLKSASLTQRGALKLSTRPSVPADEAIVSAGAEFGSEFTGRPTTSLVVYARAATPRLAWNVRFEGTDADGNGTDMSYIVDAGNGRVLDRWSNHQTAKPSGGSTCSSPVAASGVGQTLYAGDVAIGIQRCSSGSYEMKDPSRGNGYTTDLNNRTNGSGTTFADADGNFGNNTVSDRASAGADAHFGVATTWDYFKNEHGRNGIANDGKGALSRVHYGRNYVNAFWSDSCFCMTFGDGNGTSYSPLVDLDVAGHEMSHGVTSRSAGLVYSGESGGLNEATSDIFGTMVEFYANNAVDVADYMIGEEIYISNVPGSANQTALRYMYNPIKDTRSPNCYSSSLGSLDVHYSSGVANRFFYLLAEGSAAKTFNGVNHYAATCNGGSVTGLGRDAAGKIWYRALTVYMTSNTNYAGARAATMSAAADLGFSTSEVAAAWAAVSVN